LNFTPATTTKLDVLATITVSEPIQTPSGWMRISDFVFGKLYTGNMTETVIFTDFVGNVGWTGVNVDWIDKQPLVGTLSYSPAMAT
jgi:hypothetical protein